MFSFLSRFPLLRNLLDCHQVLQKSSQSLPIRSEGTFNLLLATYQRGEKEAEAENREVILSNENFDINSAEEKNQAFPHLVFSLEDSFSEADSATSKEKDN